MTALAMTVTGPAGLRDQRWLDERLAATDGMEAVIDNLSRLHLSVAAAGYVQLHVGALGHARIAWQLESGIEESQS